MSKKIEKLAEKFIKKYDVKTEKDLNNERHYGINYSKFIVRSYRKLTKI